MSPDPSTNQAAALLRSDMPTPEYLQVLAHLQARDRRETAVAAVMGVLSLGVVAAHTVGVIHFEPLALVGFVVCACWCGAVIWTLRHFRAPERLPDSGPELHRSLAHHLQRQARLLRAAPIWYAAPVFVAVTLVVLGGLGEPTRRQIAIVALTGVFCAIVGWMNVRAAAWLDRVRATIPPEDSHPPKQD